MRRVLLLLAGLLVATVVSPVASGAQGAKRATTPSRYQQIAEFFDAPAHGQGRGQVTCPPRTRVVGGGVLASSAIPTQVVLASYPSDDGRTWIGRFHNGADGETSFRVVAVCLGGVSGYSVVRGPGSSAEPRRAGPTAVTAACPAGTVVLAGGADTAGTTPRVALAAELPASNAQGWRAFYNNSSPRAVPVVAYAVCGHRPPGYELVTGGPVTLLPHRTGTAVAVCDPGIVVLGSGGAPRGGPSGALDLNSVFVEGPPVGEVYLNNRTGRRVDIVATSVCADVG